MKLTRIAVVPAAAVLALGLSLGIAGPASAHVTATPTETAAGAYTVATFAVGHGCEGSPTTSIAIQLPDSIYAVTPTRNPYYTVEKRMEKLDEPITDAHGNEITERVAQVVYTADTPLPDGQRDSFELSFQLPADAAGQTLAFPTIQTCEQGETAWTEITEEGAEEPEHPAPAFTVTEAPGDAHGAPAEEAAHESEDAEPVAAEAESDDSGNGLAIAGLAAGLAGLALGGVALARTRGRAQA